MDNTSPRKTFIPQVDGRALDAIKICAALFMVIDHINSTLLDSTRPEMFLIGRATFPLFCYAIAVGLMKAGADKAPAYGLKRYAPRLLLFAVLTEPIAQFSRDIGPTANVLFTLALGAAVAGLTYKMRDWQIAALSVLAVALMYLPTPIEFSSAGVMLPAAFLLTLRGRKLGMPCLLALLATINMGGFRELLADETAPVFAFMLLVALAAIVTPLYIIRNVAGLPQDGRYLPKYFLHIFYPLHILLIGLYARFALGMSFSPF